MEWRTANDVGILEDSAFGSWTRDELDGQIEQARKVDAQLSRVRAVEPPDEPTKRKQTSSQCPECHLDFKTAQGRAGHLSWAHRERSLRSA